ncbi:MAG: hypothetical protein J0L97_02290 [Alphaproteobacteria bacterium]|nr:hypothetical protein [Alphaproteobacteria bacterium]
MAIRPLADILSEEHPQFSFFRVNYDDILHRYIVDWHRGAWIDTDGGTIHSEGYVQYRALISRLHGDSISMEYGSPVDGNKISGPKHRFYGTPDKLPTIAQALYEAAVSADVYANRQAVAQAELGAV